MNICQPVCHPGHIPDRFTIYHTEIRFDIPNAWHEITLPFGMEISVDQWTSRNCVQQVTGQYQLASGS
jgi:hypothetical protein